MPSANDEKITKAHDKKQARENRQAWACLAVAVALPAAMLVIIAVLSWWMGR